MGNENEVHNHHASSEKGRQQALRVENENGTARSEPGTEPQRNSSFENAEGSQRSNDARLERRSGDKDGLPFGNLDRYLCLLLVPRRPS